MSEQHNITKIEIVTRPNKFEDLKKALKEVGITGMTVSKVLGCGMQKGNTEYYRGVPYEMNLLPKVKVEIVVSKVLVKKIIDTAKQVLNTGNIGDGKILIYDINNVIRIRTGEEGINALQENKEK
ncbi:MAG: family nitrogen regulator [Clostridiales bacterium]|jgi:nitrogen regulatory protein PII|nr:family nitrogen regulator [Clostridiales bacterium]